jgi:hypothetical protein
MVSNGSRDGWRCLRLPEILEPISWELGSHGYRSRCSVLLALGLTCKSLLDPAMDLLWLEQQGLGSLIKTLSSDVWKEFPGGDWDPQRYTLVGNLMPVFWPMPC